MIVIRQGDIVRINGYSDSSYIVDTAKYRGDAFWDILGKNLKTGSYESIYYVRPSLVQTHRKYNVGDLVRVDGNYEELRNYYSQIDFNKSYKVKKCSQVYGSNWVISLETVNGWYHPNNFTLIMGADIVPEKPVVSNPIKDVINIKDWDDLRKTPNVAIVVNRKNGESLFFNNALSNFKSFDDFYNKYGNDSQSIKIIHFEYLKTVEKKVSYKYELV